MAGGSESKTLFVDPSCWLSVSLLPHSLDSYQCNVLHTHTHTQFCCRTFFLSIHLSCRTLTVNRNFFAVFIRFDFSISPCYECMDSTFFRFRSLSLVLQVYVGTFDFGSFFSLLFLQHSFLLQIVVDTHFGMFRSKATTGQTTQKSQSRLSTTEKKLVKSTKRIAPVWKWMYTKRRYMIFTLSKWNR